MILFWKKEASVTASWSILPLLFPVIGQYCCVDQQGAERLRLLNVWLDGLVDYSPSFSKCSWDKRLTHESSWGDTK